jgi:hypothetical protein
MIPHFFNIHSNNPMYIQTEIVVYTSMPPPISHPSTDGSWRLSVQWTWKHSSPRSIQTLVHPNPRPSKPSSIQTLVHPNPRPSKPSSSKPSSIQPLIGLGFRLYKIDAYQPHISVFGASLIAPVRSHAGPPRSSHATWNLPSGNQVLEFDCGYILVSWYLLHAVLLGARIVYVAFICA